MTKRMEDELLVKYNIFGNVGDVDRRFLLRFY